MLLFLFLLLSNAQVRDDDNKKCFIHGMVVKCQLAKVKLHFCNKTQESEGRRPHCVKKNNIMRNGTTEKPGMMYNISCPSCVPMEFSEHLCKEKPVTPCKKDEQPKMTWAQTKRSVCPSCFKIPDMRDQCNKEQRKTCIKKLKETDLEQCVDGEVPTKRNCCFSCKSTLELAEDKCKSKIRDLPECEEISEGNIKNEAKKLNSRDNDGCRKCVPESPKRESGKKCSITDFRECRNSAPICEMNEKALVDKANLRCCSPCVRQASKANLAVVIACRKELPECETDDKSKRNIFLPGEACPICEPKKPACRDCKDRQVCVRDRDGEAKCVGKKKFVMRMKLKSVVKVALRSLKAKTMTRILKEFISRYCERNGVAEKCDNLKDRVLDSLECTGKKNGTADDEVVLDVEVAESDSTTSRRLLEEENDETIRLVNDAAQDDDDYVSSSETSFIDVDGGDDDDDDESSSSKIFVFISVFLSIIGIFQF